LFFSPLMKPPSDQLLDTSGAGIDLPAPARPRYGLRWPVVLGVATVLAILSSALAISFTRALGRPATNWTSLVVLNATYWYVWALFTPSIVWLSQHFRFERQGLVRAFLIHIPSVALFSFAHIACMAGIQWWLASGNLSYPFWSEVKRAALMNFDWEMMTYWAVVGMSHALDFHRESQERELTEAQLRTRLAEANLQALQRQLHPHFLFNTLNTISALMHRDTEAADAMLERLGDLLRLTLDRVGTQHVSLKDELDFLRKYLEIEKTRFGERLQVHIEVDLATLDAAVPNLVLQPLVENALRHGIGPKIGGGRVDIIARRDGHDLWLEVRDNGVGLTSDAFHKGVGLTNTRSRLEHLYGDRYRFECHTPPGGGLLVTVVIPFSAEGTGQSLALGPDRSDMESVA
jgi:signal transduction histidine kinase